MTAFDFANRQLPDYYPSMYLDGYSPQQILAAAHRAIQKQYLQRLEANADSSDDDFFVHIDSEVKLK